MKYRVSVDYIGHPKDIRRAAKKLIYNIGKNLGLDAKMETDYDIYAALDHGVVKKNDERYRSEDLTGAEVYAWFYNEGSSENVDKGGTFVQNVHKKRSYRTFITS